MLLVSHPSNLQEIAWNFAFHLDIAHKIWSDLYNFKQDENFLNNSDSILNAVYRDNYELKSPINQAKKSFISNIFDYSKKSIDENLILNELFEDCKLIFDKHYKIALTNLDQLENEFSQKDAISSLKSILNVMKSTV